MKKPDNVTVPRRLLEEAQAYLGLVGDGLVECPEARRLVDEIDGVLVNEYLQAAMADHATHAPRDYYFKGHRITGVRGTL